MDRFRSGASSPKADVGDRPKSGRSQLQLRVESEPSSCNHDERFFGHSEGMQMLRTSVGTIFVLFGLLAALFASGFVHGPIFYWADPFEVSALKTYATIVGATALVLGAMLIASGLLKARRAKRRSI